MNRFNWTPEHDGELVRRWNAGESAAMIAAYIGDVSRSAVIGRKSRLERDNPSLFGRRSKPANRKAHRPKSAKSQSARAPSLPVLDPEAQPLGGPRSVASNDRSGPHTAHPPAQTTGQKVDQLPSSVPLPVGGALEGPLADPVPLIDAGARRCHFPMWPDDAEPGHPAYGMVCGAPLGLPTPYAPRYCAHHAKIARAPKAERRTMRKVTSAAVNAAYKAGAA